MFVYIEQQSWRDSEQPCSTLVYFQAGFHAHAVVLDSLCCLHTSSQRQRLTVKQVCCPLSELHLTDCSLWLLEAALELGHISIIYTWLVFLLAEAKRSVSLFTVLFLCLCVLVFVFFFFQL